MKRWSRQSGFRRQVLRWLGASGSLSARLAQQGETFTVEVLSQGVQPLRADEVLALGLTGRRHAYVREVVLRVDGVALVFARSVTAQAHSLGAWRSIRGLGTRPLADVLFKRSSIRRTPLAFCRVTSPGTLRSEIAQAWQASTGEHLQARMLPARRSVFTRRGAPLLVMEVFAAEQLPWGWPSPRVVNRAPLLPPKRV